MGRDSQKFLESIRGLIEDATRDTALWCQANPSEEERAHVLAMQEQLTDLDRIIARRVERRSLPNDSRQWSETVGEVLSRLDKAREARGSIVSKNSTRGLARLADALPKELPKVRLPEPVRPVSTARTITQAPAPPKEVGGTGITHAREPKTSQVPHDPPIYFPNDLWPQTNVILLEAQRKFPLQTQTLELCKHVASEMTPLFCEAVKDGKMKAGAVLREGLGGMEDLLHFLLVHNDDGSKSGFSSLSDQAYRLGQMVRQSDEWLALAKAIAEAQRNSTAADPQPSKPGSLALTTIRASLSSRSPTTFECLGNSR
ncbi:MAG: hypothetical protein DMG40_27335 [Acidobacteria bacterium]|nr:MAG: hypothetical protein DMG40_27335 [Acidobacteriota bacterium]